MCLIKFGRKQRAKRLRGEEEEKRTRITTRTWTTLRPEASRCWNSPLQLLTLTLVRGANTTNQSAGILRHNEDCCRSVSGKSIRRWLHSLVWATWRGSSLRLGYSHTMWATRASLYTDRCTMMATRSETRMELLQASF